MFFQSLRACVMRMDQVGDDREPRLGVRRTFCPLLSRQLGLIRRNSVHSNNEKKERRGRQERAKESSQTSSVPTGTRPL